MAKMMKPRTKIILERAVSEEQIIEFHRASNAIIDAVEAGEMTEAEAVAPLTELMKGDERRARNLLMHALHREELDRLRVEKGLTID